MEQRSRAIILKTSDFGEADRIVTFFTDGFGKQRGVAKHARSSTRRFGGGLEPGTIGNVRYVERPSAELVRLEEVSVEFPAWRVLGSLKKVLALHVSLEIAERMLPLGARSGERFELLFRWINFLGEGEPSQSHCHAFYLKWLAASGLCPVFDKCVVCGKADGLMWGVSLSHGGVVCNDCRAPKAGDLSIMKETLKYLNGLKQGRIAGPACEEGGRILEAFVENAIGSRLKSLEVTRRMQI